MKPLHDALAHALGTAHDPTEAVAKVSAALLDDDPTFVPDEFWEAVIDHQLRTVAADSGRVA